MATNPKIQPCLDCGTADSLSVYKYDNGWCYVECDHLFNQRDACGYRGPGEGSVRQAIKSHNAKYEEQQLQKELREDMEDQQLADGTHYLDANGTLHQKPLR